MVWLPCRTPVRRPSAPGRCRRKWCVNASGPGRKTAAAQLLAQSGRTILVSERTHTKAIPCPLRAKIDLSDVGRIATQQCRDPRPERSERRIGFRFRLVGTDLKDISAAG